MLSFSKITVSPNFPLAPPSGQGFQWSSINNSNPSSSNIRCSLRKCLHNCGLDCHIVLGWQLHPPEWWTIITLEMHQARWSTIIRFVDGKIQLSASALTSCCKKLSSWSLGSAVRQTRIRIYCAVTESIRHREWLSKHRNTPRPLISAGTHSSHTHHVTATYTDSQWRLIVVYTESSFTFPFYSRLTVASLREDYVQLHRCEGVMLGSV